MVENYWPHNQHDLGILERWNVLEQTLTAIREQFNTYRFTDYKDKVIDLLQRVCTVSVETMHVIREMEEYQAAESK